MGIGKRLLLAATMSWIFSVTLGLLYAACASGHFSLKTLALPGVVPVSLIFSTAVSLIVTPIAMWSVRTGTRNLRTYAPIIWVILAIYILAIPGTGAYVLWGLLLLVVIGLVVLGFIPDAA